MTTPGPPRREDDDWVGTPPEGRHSASRAKPEFWRNQKPYLYASALLGLCMLVVVVLIVLAD